MSAEDKVKNTAEQATGKIKQAGESLRRRQEAAEALRFSSATGQAGRQAAGAGVRPGAARR